MIVIDTIKTASEFNSLFLSLEEYVKQQKESGITELWLVRHGQSEANALGINAGQQDYPITLNGEKQAREVAQILTTVVDEFGAAYCSTLQRTHQTHAAINEVWSQVKGSSLPEPKIEKDIIERFCGALEGMHEKEYLPYKEREKEDIAKLTDFSDKFSYKMRHADNSIVEDQESLAETYARGLPALIKIAKENVNKKVLLNTHLGLMRAVILGLAASAPEPKCIDVRSFELGNCAVVVLEFKDDELRLKAARGLAFKA
jgi:broad specificity phosphatase PhoE